MTQISKNLRRATAAATLLLLGALAYQCIAIFMSGAFTREIVSAHLRPLLLPTLAWALLALASGVTGQDERSARRAQKPAASQKIPESRQTTPVRIALYAVAAALIALGVINGGLRDVLVKAINICTECIGLG